MADKQWFGCFVEQLPYYDEYLDWVEPDIEPVARKSSVLQNTADELPARGGATPLWIFVGLLFFIVTYVPFAVKKLVDNHASR